MSEASAVRILGRFTGDKVSEVVTETVEMTVPAGLDGEPSADDVGFWLELRDDAGKVLYRQVMLDPFSPYVEVPTEPGEHLPFEMVEVAEPSGYLVLLVPGDLGGRLVALVRAAPDEGSTEVVRTDVVTFPTGQR